MKQLKIILHFYKKPFKSRNEKEIDNIFKTSFGDIFQIYCDEKKEQKDLSYNKKHMVISNKYKTIKIKFKCGLVKNPKNNKLFFHDLINRQLNHKIIINNKYYPKRTNLIDINRTNNFIHLQIQLFEKSEIKLNSMFEGCLALKSLAGKLDLEMLHIKSINKMFYNCKYLETLSDLVFLNTSNIVDMSLLFHGCENLKNLPDLSKFNTKNLKRINGMFKKCKSLEVITDISKWNTNNIISMYSLFDSCQSLISLPDISQWNTSKVRNMSRMFCGCISLKEFPDISKWNIENVQNMSYMFSSRYTVISPKFKNYIKKGKYLNIFQQHNLSWEEALLEKVYILGDQKNMFPPSSITSLPDISKWNTKNVKNMSFMFEKLSNIKSLPDISNWDISKVENMEGMFQNCSGLISLPDISNWNTSNVKYMTRLF